MKLGASGEFYPSLYDYVDGDAGPRVLLAERDDELRHFFATQLRRHGYAVLAVANGAEALVVLAAITRNELPAPQVGVLDIDMPDHSGVEVLERIRRVGWRMPMIMMTSNASRAAPLDLGPRLRPYVRLGKPFSSNRLVTLIDEALQLYSGRKNPPGDNDNEAPPVDPVA